MGVLRIDHPDIAEFVGAKQNSHNLTKFNISVGVTDEFMASLLSGDHRFPLRFTVKYVLIVFPTKDGLKKRAVLWSSEVEPIGNGGDAQRVWVDR